MSAEQKILDLLYYMREKGLTPSRYRRQDRFLNPFTRRIARKHQLQPHQLRYALWIPTAQGIKQHLPDLELENCRGTIIASTRSGHVGAGAGESEAILSLVGDLRRAAA